MHQVNFADYLGWVSVSEKQKSRSIRQHIVNGEKVNTMCYTPDIRGLLNLKKYIPM